jgi:hypothetical protein
MKKLFKMIFNPDGKNMIPEDQDAIDYLILNKGLEVVGVDSKTGELLYSFTPKIKELMPDLYDAHINHVNKEIMALWEKGFVNVDFLSDNPIVTLSDKAFIASDVATLSKDHQWALEEMKRLMKKRNF